MTAMSSFASCIPFIILQLFLGTALAQSPLLLLKESVPVPDHRLAYAPHELGFGELRLPKAVGPHPVVVLIHGGCWKAELPGKDPRATSLDLLKPIAAALTDAGFATWNVEYRRHGNAGGGWPGTFHDLGEAIDFLRTLALPHALDLNQVIVAGHSSGGQLAFWAGARPRLPEFSPLYKADALPVRAVVNLDGPIDLKAAAPFAEKFCGFSAIHEFMGGSPEEHPDRYLAGSATSILPMGVRQEIIVGSLLTGIGDQVSQYVKDATSKGDPVGVLHLEQAGHFGFLFPDSEHWRLVQARMKSLIEHTSPAPPPNSEP